MWNFLPFFELNKALQQFAQPIVPLPQDLKVDLLIDEGQRQ